MAGHIKRIFARRDLDLCLDAFNPAVGIKDDRDIFPPRLRELFRAEDGRNAIRSRQLCHGLQYPLRLFRTKRQHVNIRAAQAGQVSFGETGDPYTLRGAIRDQRGADPDRRGSI